MKIINSNALNIERIAFIFAIIVFLFFGLPRAGNSKCTAVNEYSNMAEYKVTLVSLSPLMLHVNSRLPINGNMLDMEQTYPADLPEMAANGWTALISNLYVTDESNKKIEVISSGKKGWELIDSIQSFIDLSYDVDYSIFAASDWSSSLESAFADDTHAIVIGRSVFITTSLIKEININIETPKGWNTITPWKKTSLQKFKITSRDDLTNNMLVFSRSKPDIVIASGFKMQIVSMGHWEPLTQLLKKTLKTIIRREVDIMNFREKEIYTVILLPISDEGGSAYRQSFVYCYNDPKPDNKDIWGNTLAHEIFHYWNYSRLKGASYSESQWFQEGFTEYIANLVMVTGKIIDPDTFLKKLSVHVNNYRKLTTSLENYGTHKGPPLYSAGALVAFMWDIKIREATDGKRSISDLFRNLMKQTDSGKRKYSWEDIKEALQKTADADWESFYQSYIKGKEQLPLDSVLPLVGLSLTRSSDGSEQVIFDTTQSKERRNLFNKLIGN